MSPQLIPAAERLVESLISTSQTPHTPELVRAVRDCELLPDHDRAMLTAYAWYLQATQPYPRDPKTLICRFIAYAEAERDAWELDGHDYAAKHGFSPKELGEVREILLGVAAETVENFP